MDDFSFIDDEIKDLKLDEYSINRPRIKIASQFGETGWIRLNAETVKEIQALLKREEENARGGHR